MHDSELILGFLPFSGKSVGTLQRKLNDHGWSKARAEDSEDGPEYVL